MQFTMPMLEEEQRLRYMSGLGPALFKSIEVPMTRKIPGLITVVTPIAWRN